MFTRTGVLEDSSPLATALPDAEFVEHHDIIVAATPDRVWDALLATRWADLLIARPLIAVRSGGRRDVGDDLLTDPRGPGRPNHLEPPSYYTSGWSDAPGSPARTHSAPSSPSTSCGSSPSRGGSAMAWTSA